MGRAATNTLNGRSNGKWSSCDITRPTESLGKAFGVADLGQTITARLGRGRRSPRTNVLQMGVASRDTVDIAIRVGIGKQRHLESVLFSINRSKL